MSLETDTADELDKAAGKIQGEFAIAMQGASPAAQSAYKNVTGTNGNLKAFSNSELSALKDIEARAVAVHKRGGAEAALILRREGLERKAKLDASIATGHNLTRAHSHLLESALIESLIPPVSTDSGARGLSRGEIDQVGNDVHKLVGLVGLDPTTTGEVFDYGRRHLLEAQPDKQLRDAVAIQFDSLALGKLKAGATTKSEKAAVLALSKIQQYRGSFDANRSAMNMRRG
jgi:hypothetical protein